MPGCAALAARAAEAASGIDVAEDGDDYRILRLRAEILELGSAARQLQRAGLDDASTQLLLCRKRADLESLMKPAHAVQCSEKKIAPSS